MIITELSATFDIRELNIGEYEMYYQMKIQYEDGVKQVVDTEPTRAMLARSLMLDVFYQDPEIVSIRFYDNNKGKALHINR